MNLARLKVDDDYYRLHSGMSRTPLFGRTEKGKKVTIDQETILSKGQTIRFTEVGIGVSWFEDADVSKLKRVLTKDTRLFISCDRKVFSDQLHVVLDLLDSYRNNIVMLICHIDNKDGFIKELLKRNLNIYIYLIVDYETNMENELLQPLINLYESNMKVGKLDLRNIPVITSSMPEWQTLKNLIQEKRVTVIGKFFTHKLETDAAWLKSFLSSFSGGAYLQVRNHEDMFQYSIFNRPHLEKQSELNITLMSAAPTATIDELSAELIKVNKFALAESSTNIQSLSPITRVKQLLIPAVFKSLEVSTNIVRVKLRDRASEIDLSNYEIGREILALMGLRDSAKVKQFIESDMKGALNRTKLMVIGAGGAGKTSCCRALLGEAFVKEHLSTIVADGSRDLVLLDAKDINISEAWTELPTDDSKFYQRDFDAIRMNMIREGIELNQKANNNPTSEGILQRKTAKTQEKKPEYKFEERVSRILRRKEKDEVSSAFDLKEFEKRARGMKLTLWDFGGQAVFDAAHHFYLSNQGVVLLVFNVENWINNRKKEEQNVKKWLASLMFYSPNTKVFLVGTRTGAVVPEVLEEVSEALDELHLPFDDVEVIENETDELFFFPVENSEPERNKKLIQNLRESIKTVLKDPKAPWKKEVPLSWLFFMHLLDSKDKNVTSLSEVYAFAQEKGFSKKNVRELLKFFTEAGSIVSFEERFRKLGNSAELVDDTVLKPKWLLKSLACFLFDDIHAKSKKALYKLGKGMKSKVFLLMNGFLSRDLLHKILKADASPKKQREALFLENLCERMLVMSPVDQITTTLTKKVNQKHLIGEAFWLLPSMLNRESNVGVQEEVFFKNDQSVTVSWNSVTPQGLFERFVASFCKVAKGKQGLKLLSMSSTNALIELREVKMKLSKESLQEFKVSFSPVTQVANALVNELIGEVLAQIRGLELAFELGAEVSPTLELVKTKEDVSIKNSISTKQNSDLEWDFDCFLSHSWGDYPDFETHNQVLRIAARLKHEGFSVWVDANELNATVAGELHRGIDGSACFIAFVTKKYLKSADDRDNNAGKEFNYAALKNGADSIVPVLLDPEFRNPKDWRGNVGIHLGNALYVDFTSAEAQDENMNNLCTRIKKLSMRKRQRRKIDE